MRITGAHPVVDRPAMRLLDQTYLAWCEIDDTLIFLDLAKDRYFRLTERRNRETLEAIDRSGLHRFHQPTNLPRPQAWTEPERASPAIGTGTFQLAEVARAFWTGRRVEQRLATRTFFSVMGDFRKAVIAASAEGALCGPAACSTIRAFEYARLLRTAADRCLPRSIALASCLAVRGVRAHIVIGVKLAPFGAHCWTQLGDEVLNDSVEEVLRYRPILVI